MHICCPPLPLSNFIDIKNIFLNFYLLFFFNIYFVSMDKNIRKSPNSTKKHYPLVGPPPLGLSTFWKLIIFKMRNFHQIGPLG